MDQTKPFSIAKREVWEAFKRVKANQGAAGVDGQSIAEFEANLSGNLYKLWNRLSSGSYFPPPVRRSELRLVEVAVVGDPTADHRIVDRGQLFQGLVTAVVQRPSLKRIDAYVIRWARRKYKRMVHQTKGGRDWLDRRRRKTPTLFAHWPLCHGGGRTSGAV